VKGVLGLASVGGRVGENVDHLVELHDRPGPAMGDQQGFCIRVGTRSVDEVNTKTLDLGDVLGKTVVVGLPRSPVVPVQPVVGEFPGVGERDALVPVERLAVARRFGIGPTGAGEPFAQIGQICIRCVYLEFINLGHGCSVVGSVEGGWGLVGERGHGVPMAFYPAR